MKIALIKDDLLNWEMIKILSFPQNKGGNIVMGLGFLDNLFCDDNTLLIIILILVVVLLFSGGIGGIGDNCGSGFSFGNFNLGDNWILIVVVLLVVFGDGLNIF